MKKQKDKPSQLPRSPNAPKDDKGNDIQRALDKMRERARSSKQKGKK